MIIWLEACVEQETFFTIFNNNKQRETIFSDNFL